jgi:hypothetical protein
MKQVEAKLLGTKERSFTVPFKAFSNLAEAVADAGGEENLLAKVNGWSAAHGTFGDARELIVDCILEVTKVPFLTKKEKVTREGKEVTLEVRDTAKDSDAGYSQRALALKPDAFDAVQALVTKRAAGYTYKGEDGKDIVVPELANSLKAKVRVPGSGKSGKLAEKYKTAALLFLDGKKDLKKFVAALEKKGLGTFAPKAGVPANDPANVEALGWLCKSWQDAQDAFAGM